MILLKIVKYFAISRLVLTTEMLNLYTELIIPTID